jgi:hypothetical protein
MCGRLHTHVKRHEATDRREEQELGRPGDRANEHLLGREVLLEFGSEVGIAGLFAQACSFTFQEHRGVCLPNDGSGGDRNNSNGDSQYPEDPSPASRLT